MQYRSNSPAGHPIHTYQQEALLCKQILEELANTDIMTNYHVWFNLFNQLATVEKRFQRKENQLFPFLEQANWTGPSKNMWSFHDTLRDIFRLVRKNIEDKDFQQAVEHLTYIDQNLRRLFDLEDTVLFPKSMDLLQQEAWIQMRLGEDEIGWMLQDTPPRYPSDSEYIHPSMDTERRTDVVFHKDAQHFDEGFMTTAQVNLLLKTLPIDITYVDQEDRVIFYNRGEERVFPRSSGIIGREVKFCHPPKSVDTVIQIVEAFKSGKENEASFWFTYKERLIYVRYFAVRDKALNYHGVIEMSQDITDIKHIEGERRLLEWN